VSKECVARGAALDAGMKSLAGALALLAAGCGRDAPAAIGAASAAPAVTSVTSASSAIAAPTPPSTSEPRDAGTDAAVPAPRRARAVTPPGECAEGMARVGRFCIDRWEAHLVVRDAAGEPSKLPFFARPPEDGAYEACSEAGVMPQAYISRVEAQAACRNAGKRLCEKAEWQRACQGSLGNVYPYGERWQAKRCNMDKPHLLAARFGPDARRWHYDQFNDPTLNQTPGFLAPAGTYPECVGDAGVYDLVGNLHEWVSDTVDQELMDHLAAEQVERNEQPWRPGNGVFMGGFFSTHEQLGPGCKYITVAHEPAYHDYSTGFRCCAAAPVVKAPPPRKN
jgi:hypothetical protein